MEQLFISFAQFALIMISFVPFPFSSSLRIKRAAGSWNDEELEELEEEELVEEVKSAEQVDRVLQELEQKPVC